MMAAKASAGSIAELGDLLARMGAQRIFLVTGRHSYLGSGAREAVAEALGERQSVHFDRFSSNPTVEEVERGVALFRASACDVILAVGGGSAIDMAKAINVCAAAPATVVELARGASPIASRSAPLIAVPTTAGSGSEATHFATLYLGDTKLSLTHELLLPDHVILDPDLLRSLPSQLRAATGVDALSQAIEAFWSVRSSEESRAFSVRAISLIREALPTAVRAPTAQAREDMLTAAHLAGRAIRIARTTAPHALAYRLTSRFGIPHGHAVGLTLGAIFALNGRVEARDARDPRGAQWVRERVAQLSGLLAWPADDGVSSAWRNLLVQLGLETRLGPLGVRRADIPALVAAVNPERLANNPRELTPELLGSMLEDLL